MSKIRHRRIWIWVLFLALIGAFIQTKSAVITLEDILIGMLVGGAIGYFLGSILGLVTNR